MSDQTYANEIKYQGKVFNVGDLRYTPAGNAVCNARMNTFTKFEEGWESFWFDLTCWDDAAETLASLPDKSEVIVSGRIGCNAYRNRAGEVVTGMVLHANRLEAAGSFEAPVATPVQNYEDVPF